MACAGSLPEAVLNRVGTCLQSKKHLPEIRQLLTGLTEEQLVHLLVEERVWVDTEGQSHNALSRFIFLSTDGDWLQTLETMLDTLSKEHGQAVLTRQDDGGNSALHYSVLAGNLTLCQKFCLRLTTIGDKMSIIVRNAEGHSPIHLAARRGNVEILKILLNQPSVEPKAKLIGQKDGEGFSILHWVVKTSCNELLVYLLENLDARDQRQQANELVSIAITRHSTSMVRTLLSKLSSDQVSRVISLQIPEQADRGNSQMLETLLAYVTESSGLEIVELKNKFGMSLLSLAVSYGNLAVAKIVVNLIPLNDLESALSMVDKVGDNSIHQAVRMGNPKLLEILLEELPENERGSVLCKQTLEGYNAAHLAVKRGELSVLETMLTLLKASKNREQLIQQKDNNEDSVLHLAIQHGKLTIFSRLWSSIEIKYQMITQENLKKVNLLHQAVKLGNEEILLQLFEFQQQLASDIGTLADIRCNNVLHLALTYRKQKLLKHLKPHLFSTIEKGMAVTFQNKQGYSPIHLAIRQNDINSLRLLLGMLKQEHQSDALLKPTKDGDQAILLALKYQRKQMLEFILGFIEQRKSVSVFDAIQQQDKYGRNAVQVAVSKKCSDLLNNVLSQINEVDVLALLTVQDSQGLNAFHTAVQQANAISAGTLIGKVGDPASLISSQSRNGDNGFHLAASLSNHKAIKLFKKYLKQEEQQILIRTENNNGETPLSVACRGQVGILLDLAMNGSLPKDELREFHRRTSGLFKELNSELAVSKTELEFDMVEILYQILTPPQRLVETLQEVSLWAAVNNRFEILESPGVFLDHVAGRSMNSMASTPLHVAVRQNNVTCLSRLLAIIPKDSLINRLKQKDGKGNGAFHLAVKSGREEVLKKLLGVLSTPQTVDLIIHRNTEGSSTLEQCPTIFNRIEEHKLPAILSRLMQHVISTCDKKLLQVLCKSHKTIIKDRLSRLIREVPLKRDQIDILTPFSKQYIIPTNQAEARCVSLVLYNYKDKSDHSSMKCLFQALRSYGFQGEPIEWTTPREWAPLLTNAINKWAHKSSLLWITVVGDVNAASLLNTVTQALKTHKSLPVVVHIHTPEADEGDEDIQPPQVSRQHTVCLQSRSNSNHQSQNTYMTAMAEELGKADGTKSIHAMHTAAVDCMCQDGDGSPDAEYTDRLRKLLILPPRLKKLSVATEKVESSGTAASSDFEPIPTHLLNSLSGLCETHSVEYAIILQDPVDSKHIVVQGKNAESIPEADIKQVLESANTSFRITRRNNSDILHTNLLTLDPILTITKSEWILGNGWTDSRQACCELLVNAIERRNVRPEAERSAYSVGPAHMVIRENSRELFCVEQHKQTAREEVEKNSTSNRYIIRIEQEAASHFYLGHPPLMCYRYWCSLIRDTECMSCQEFRTTLTNNQLNPTANQPDFDGLDICIHMTMNDAIFLLLNTQMVSDLRSALASNQNFQIEDIHHVATIGKLKTISNRRLKIAIGTYSGELISFPMSPGQGCFFGLHLLFILKSRDDDGNVHELEPGDCGHIVFLDQADDVRVPIGMFIGSVNLKDSPFPFKMYRAVLLHQMLREMETEYSHHVEQVELIRGYQPLEW